MSTEPEIDWPPDVVEGVALDALTQRLMRQTRQAGYDEGYRDGRQFGAEEALRASTQLTTALASRPTQRAIAVLERLLRIVAEAEDERPSVYWSDEP
jgi:hypothetical protein